MRKIKTMSIIGVLGLSSMFILSACFHIYKRQEMPFDTQDFFELSVERQHEKFIGLSIENKYYIYVYAMTKIHPPDLFFADAIASHGETVIPFMMDRLRNEKDEYIQQIIILVFDHMVWHYHFVINQNEELIGLLREVISAMRQSYYKKLATLSFERILRNGT